MATEYLECRLCKKKVGGWSQGINNDNDNNNMYSRLFAHSSTSLFLPPSFSPREEMQGPDGQPGYQHVLKLAKALLEARSLQGLSDKRVDELMALWQRLHEPDRRRVVYPPRHRERQLKGKNTSCPGKESLQRCLLGLNSGPATWPSASRLVEAICSQLCRLTRTRWSLILTDYVAVREAVLASPRLMAQTEIQLFELNQRTLSQWFSRRQKERGVSVLLQGTGVVPAVAVAVQPLPPAKGLSFVQVGQGQPFNYNIPEVPGPSGVGLPASSGHIPPPPPPPPLQTLLPAGPLTAAPAAQPPPLRVPRTTAYRKRKAAEADAARGGPSPWSKARQQTGQYTCSNVARPRGSTLATLALQVCLTARLPVGKLWRNGGWR
ncbi:uncharacterized protein LOC117490986 isoform X3 [Trematomus bernacchii]|uniref:uncharacterized protein LOC117490986 isoform X3 n=1 Tax=Trematomus bernacchii TaxID=40690 RepID=UPI00146BEE01|nr:uncharacterized protein LOC117490986 isoform X3 [Trematomus bernacchii]